MSLTDDVGVDVERRIVQGTATLHARTPNSSTTPTSTTALEHAHFEAEGLPAARQCTTSVSVALTSAPLSSKKRT